MTELHPAPSNPSKLPSVLIQNQQVLYKLLILLFSKQKFLNVSSSHLTLSVDSLESLYVADSSSIKFSPNLIYLPKPGRYVGSYNNRTYWLTFTCSPTAYLTTMSRSIQYERSLKIETTGDSVEPITTLIQESLNKLDHSSEDELIVYENAGGGWVKTKGKRSRTLKSVILDKSISNELIEDIQEFISSKDWYVRLGVPYRRGYLLEGPPGTGKSSFAQAISGHLGLSLCFINISDRSLNDFNFNRLMNKTPAKSIILLQDIDAMFEGRKNTEETKRLTYSGFLNSIDGVRSQEGRIVIMTTNHKEKLDPALLRPGRVDFIVRLDYATKYQIKCLFERFFGDAELAEKVADRVPENTFSMAQLQGFFVKYRKTPSLILTNIEQLLTTEQNVKIDNWLRQINCKQAIPFFKMQGYGTIAAVKNLANETITALLGSRVSNVNIVRIIESLRTDDFQVVKDEGELGKIVESYFEDGEVVERWKGRIGRGEIRTNHELVDAIKKEKEAGSGKKVE